MVLIKKPKNSNSVRSQLGSLVRQIGIEVVGELKEMGKETLGMRPKEKNWADEWLKDKDPNKPEISKQVGQYSQIDPEKQFAAADQRKLKQVQAKLSQEFLKPPQKPEEPVYDKTWKQRQEKEEEQAKKAAAAVKIPPLSATGSKRPAGDWMKRLNRVEYASSKD